jgi:hypothetical protein
MRRKRSWEVRDRQLISSQPLLDTGMRRSCTTQCALQNRAPRNQDAARISRRDNFSRGPDGTHSLDGSLSIQPHGGITLTTRMRAYRQASRRVPSHLLRPAATVACVHGGPDRTHGRARNESGYRLSYKNSKGAVTPGITLGGYPDVRPKPPVSPLHRTHAPARRQAFRGLGCLREKIRRKERAAFRGIPRT